MTPLDLYRGLSDADLKLLRRAFTLDRADTDSSAARLFIESRLALIDLALRERSRPLCPRCERAYPLNDPGLTDHTRQCANCDREDIDEVLTDPAQTPPLTRPKPQN